MTERSPTSAIPDDAAFNAVVSAFADDRQVRPPESGGRFGDRRALKVNGKIFAMMSSKGHFVVKLSKERVSEVARAGRGVAFDPGHGRLSCASTVASLISALG